MNTSEQNGHVASAVVAIELAKIIPSTLEPQEHRRKHFTPESLAELAASLKEQGQLQAIIVRPHLKKKDHFELVAGERRYRACLLNQAATIDASVRDLSDEVVVQIQLQENLQRKEVEPLDEAFSYKWLLEHCTIDEGGVKRPYTVADIAARFAKTREMIFRRLKLNDLCEKGSKDLADGKLPLAHAELIACFPEREQKELLDRYMYSWNGNPLPLKDVRASVEQRMVRNLAKAPFDIADASLHPKGLVCSDCQERTGFMPGLFEGELGKNDSCMNGKCFLAKTNAALLLKRTEIATTRPNAKGKHTLERLEKAVPLIRNSYSDAKPLGKDATYVDDRYYDRKFELAKKADECPDVETALWVEGEKVGKTQLICRNGKCTVHKAKKKSSGISSSPSRDPKYLEKQLNEDAAERVRTAVITARINSFNEKHTPWSTPDLRLTLLTSLACLHISNGLDEAFPDGIETIIPANLAKLVRTYNPDRAKVRAAVEAMSDKDVSRLFALAAFGAIGFCYYGDKPEVARAEVRNLANDLGLNYQLLDAEARLELVKTQKHKEIITEYIEQVKAGTATEPPKIFDVPKPKTTAKKPAPKKKAAKAAGA